MNVKLTDVERLTLLNQFKILNRITPEADQDMDYGYVIQVLENGFEHDYKEIFNNNLFKSVPKDVTEFVHNVLYMYRCIQQSYELLYANKATECIQPVQIAFDGFTESEGDGYLRYCEFLALNEFYPEHKNKSLLSHVPVLQKYKDMLSHFASIEVNDQPCMNAKQLKAILGV